MIILIAPVIGEIDLRFLAGGYWKYLKPSERMAFVRGFIMGSVATEASIAAGEWQSKYYSLVEIYDQELYSALNELYLRRGADDMPLIVAIFELVKESRIRSNVW
jgi:hypothetical protein